ncbi:MAG TPA: hypothetical protein VGE93_20245, partial [Bryobacteraceae bacterium]
ESISGDLLEEYREQMLPRLGVLGSNLWYLRQLISIASMRVLGTPAVQRALVLICLFAIAAGIWLGTMEHILRHDGYLARSVIAACIAVQGLATLLYLLLHGRSVFRRVVITGAVGIILLGGSAILRISRAQHFEGFVLLIGLALLLQGALTLATLLQTRYKAPAR